MCTTTGCLGSVEIYLLGMRFGYSKLQACPKSCSVQLVRKTDERCVSAPMFATVVHERVSNACNFTGNC